MKYRLRITKQAQRDIDFHKKSGNKTVIKKLFILLNELTEHPFDDKRLLKLNSYFS